MWVLFIPAPVRRAGRTRPPAEGALRLLVGQSVQDMGHHLPVKVPVARVGGPAPLGRQQVYHPLVAFIPAAEQVPLFLQQVYCGGQGARCDPQGGGNGGGAVVPALIHRPAHGVDQVQLPQGEVFPGQAGGLRLQDLAKHLHQKLVEHLSAALHPDRPLCIRS